MEIAARRADSIDGILFVDAGEHRYKPTAIAALLYLPCVQALLVDLPQLVQVLL